jgi:hypothetical protein
MDFASRLVRLEHWSVVMKIVHCVVLSAALALLSHTHAAHAQSKSAPKDAKLYFITPRDGQTIKGGFWCRFGLRNMGVTHAGDDYENSGHHHLLIDVKEPIDPKEPIPQDKSHLHFGAGQTETYLDLPRGTHTLQLVLGDGKHYTFNPSVVSAKITIRVR